MLCINKGLFLLYVIRCFLAYFYCWIYSYLQNKQLHRHVQNVQEFIVKRCKIMTHTIYENLSNKLKPAGKPVMNKNKHLQVRESR